MTLPSTVHTIDKKAFSAENIVFTVNSGSPAENNCLGYGWNYTLSAGSDDPFDWLTEPAEEKDETLRGISAVFQLLSTDGSSDVNVYNAFYLFDNAWKIDEDAAIFAVGDDLMRIDLVTADDTQEFIEYLEQRADYTFCIQDSEGNELISAQDVEDVEMNSERDDYGHESYKLIIRLSEEG